MVKSVRVRDSAMGVNHKVAADFRTPAVALLCAFGNGLDYFIFFTQLFTSNLTSLTLPHSLFRISSYPFQSSAAQEICPSFLMLSERVGVTQSECGNLTSSSGKWSDL
ncbi:hypothetical protein RRG08_024713 [Elysia crispata]|uniref:Uncharacterized protein n=1 Tax=Elysia crispata TaxID=231223 RepID=A0AAE1CXG7_9GAST|nr:hypothetical protein RRG08_024713 [Elysia crispata]